MKRICFDSGSDWYKPPLESWLTTAADARDRFHGKSFKFYCATAFIYPEKRYIDFTDPVDLFKCLAHADEIITFNGRICDLIVLESQVGEEAAKTLWAKPHHDLQGWRGCQSLKEGVSRVLPKLSTSYESIEKARKEKIGAKYVPFMAEKLANTYRDAKFTHHLFDRYLASGDTSHTFNEFNLDMVIPHP